jgi:hypothetical protein
MQRHQFIPGLDECLGSIFLKFDCQFVNVDTGLDKFSQHLFAIAAMAV